MGPTILNCISLIFDTKINRSAMKYLKLWREGTISETLLINFIICALNKEKQTKYFRLNMMECAALLGGLLRLLASILRHCSMHLLIFHFPLADMQRRQLALSILFKIPVNTQVDLLHWNVKYFLGFQMTRTLDSLTRRLKLARH